MSSANEWPRVKLGDLALIQAGGTPSRKNSQNFGEGLPWVKISDMDSLIVRSTEESITELGLESSSVKLFPEGTILLSIFATVGKVAVLGMSATTNQAIAGIQLKSDAVLPSFLVHFLKFSEGELKSLGRGVAQNNINLSKLRNFEIPLPPLPEQQRIAEILDMSSSNLASRKAQLEQLSALENSIFEQFHLAHLGQATQYHLKDVVPSIDSGKSPVCENRPAMDDEWGILKLSSVTTGEFLQDENKAYLKNTESLSHLVIHPGDLLMTRKNTPELVGAVSLVRETRPNLLLPDLIFRLNLNRNLVEPEYLAPFLMSAPVRFSIRALAGGSAKSMSNISKQRLNKLLIDLPSLDTQREFVTKSQEIQELKRQVSAAHKLEEELQKSLSTREFAGQL